MVFVEKSMRLDINMYRTTEVQYNYNEHNFKFQISNK